MSTEQMSNMTQNIIPHLEEKEELQLKKYRDAVYDIHDSTYATELKKSFSYIENDLKIKFMLFTDNLMDEKQINRFSLLKAIDDFDKNEKNISEINNHEWMRFTDMAFNCRPYQPCSVM